MRTIKCEVIIGDISVRIMDADVERQKKRAIEELKKIPGSELKVTETYYLDFDGNEYNKIRDIKVYIKD